jgi:putative heme-binding domain-containing protein
LLQRGSSHGSVFPAAVAAFASLAGHDIGQPAITAVFEDFTRDAKNTKWLGDFAKALADKDAPKRALAATVLVNLASSNLVKGKDKEAAVAAVEKGWAKPESSAALLTAIARTKSQIFAAQVDAHLKDPNNAVAEAALFAHQALGLGAAGAVPQKPIGEMKYEMLAALVQKGGDTAQGKEMFLRAGCIACHTIGPDEPPKGPILSAVAKIYDRAALLESIVKPNAKIAQGFETTWVKTKKGEQVEGFVTREGGDSVDLRNIIGQTVTIEKGDITDRGHREISMMPEGLLNTFTAADLANLLAYLESLKGS